MKIKTVTIFRSFNYGALLQTYALHKKLNDMGHDCSVLNYRPPATEQKMTNIVKKSKDIKSFVYNLIPLLKYNETKRMIKKADDFLNKHIKLSERYESYKEILNAPHDTDIFFCGSDQIWNPNIFNGLDPLYFLDFVNSQKSIKASFAASLGGNYIDDKYKKEYQDYLSDFDFISVREEKAKELLEFTNKPIEVIADPVFLLTKEEWLNLAIKPNIKEKYILCYFLYQPKYLNKIIQKIKEETGLKVISVTFDAYTTIKSDKVIRDVGPDEFLGLIANAELVLTSSFHGTVLSILLEKQFYTAVWEKRGSRIKGILKKLNLSHREINESDNSIDIYSTIDYSETNKLILSIRDNSMKFLEKVLLKAKARFGRQ
ncbi:MAG: polysaccharide pyruvyl transferase family protein [Flavobacteriaceae bacterium]|nr:polysaccharide pyruvyl transferase family protein [Flavobacteriaceae bacterium]